MPEETKGLYWSQIAPFLIILGTFIAIMVGGYIAASIIYARTRFQLFEEKGARLGAGMLAATILCLVFFS